MKGFNDELNKTITPVSSQAKSIDAVFRPLIANIAITTPKGR